MRQIDGIAPGVMRDFVPEAYENKKEDSPIVVTIRQPTEGEKRRILTKGVKLSFTEDGKIQDANTLDTEFIAARNMRIVGEFVTAVTNYVGSDGKAIDDGARLAEHGESEIVSEVAAEIMIISQLTDEERKKS